MSQRAETVKHLRDGKPLAFHLQGVDWSEGHELLDDLERLVGLPLERREFIDKDGSTILCWVKGLSEPPIVSQYKGARDAVAD